MWQSIKRDARPRIKHPPLRNQNTKQTPRKSSHGVCISTTRSINKRWLYGKRRRSFNDASISMAWLFHPLEWPYSLSVNCKRMSIVIPNKHLLFVDKRSEHRTYAFWVLTCDSVTLACLSKLIWNFRFWGNLSLHFVSTNYEHECLEC